MGLTKVMEESVSVVVVDQLGIGHWFSDGVGALEVVGAVALLYPRSAGWAAIVLALLMAGTVPADLLSPATAPSRR
jgi:uncharacterized membrane protein YphA (DoxX/SURF4 family)